MGEYVLQKDMPCWKTCLTGLYILWEAFFCRRTCLAGGHVLQRTCLAEDMSSRWHILL